MAHVRAVDCKGQRPLLPAPKRSSLERFYKADLARGLPSGDLFTVASYYWHAGDKSPQFVLEVWPREGERTRTWPIRLPSQATAGGRVPVLRTHGLFVRSPTEVLFAATLLDERDTGNGRTHAAEEHWIPPYFAVFDGTAWTPIEPPPISTFTDIQMTDDGTLLLAALPRGRHEGGAEELWTRAPGAGWERLGSLPDDPHTRKPYETHQIRARSLDDIWVLCRSQRDYVLYHNRRPQKAVAF